MSLVCHAWDCFLLFPFKGPRPVPADAVQHGLHLRRAAGDEAAACGGHLCLLVAVRFDRALRITPGPSRVHVRQDIGVTDYLAQSGLDTAMAVVHGWVQVPERRTLPAIATTSSPRLSRYKKGEGEAARAGS